MNNQTNGYVSAAYERVTVVLPPVRFQKGPTCVFNAVAYMLESQNQGLKIDVNSFFDDYLKMVMVPFGQDQNRVITALEMFKDQGVIASICDGPKTRVHISGYESHPGMDHSQVFAMIQSGTPLLGTFAVQKRFHTLGGDIYKLNPNEPVLGTHIVMFVGYGERKGRPYLVFLNSYGPHWGTLGLGRVYYDQVYQLEDDKGFQFITLTVDNGVGTSLAVTEPPSPDDKPLPLLEMSDQVETYLVGHSISSYSSFPYDEAVTFNGWGVYPDAFANAENGADIHFQIFKSYQEKAAFGHQGATCGQTPDCHKYREKMQVLKNKTDKAASFESVERCVG